MISYQVLLAYVAYLPIDDSTLATGGWQPLVTPHYRTVREEQNKPAASSAGHLE